MLSCVGQRPCDHTSAPGAPDPHLLPDHLSSSSSYSPYSLSSLHSSFSSHAWHSVPPPSIAPHPFPTVPPPISGTTYVQLYMLVVIHRHSALTYITSCTELLTHFVKNQKSWYSHPSIVLALYSFNPLELKCITQNKTQRSQKTFCQGVKFGSWATVWTTLLCRV